MSADFAAFPEPDLAAIVEAMPIGITVFDPDHRIGLMNAAFRRATNASAETTSPGLNPQVRVSSTATPSPVDRSGTQIAI